MNTLVKIIIIVLMAVYCLSPVDLVPGPIDDLVVLAIGFASMKGMDRIKGEEA